MFRTFLAVGSFLLLLLLQSDSIAAPEKDSEALFLDTAKVPWQPVEGVPGGTWKPIRTDPVTGAVTALVQFEAGTIEKPHHHSQGHMIYIVSGSKIVKNHSADKEFKLSEGMYLYTPAGNVHSIRYLTRCIFLFVTDGPFDMIWEEDSPENIVRNFYQTYLDLKFTGLPSDSQLQSLSKYLAPELISLFHEAQKVQDDFIKQNPDEKPPWIEGDLFSSLFEGPTGFEIGAVEKTSEGSRVKVKFHYVNTLDPKDQSEWEDAVLLKNTPDGLLIYDIELLGNWEFKTGNRLSDILKSDL